MDTPVSFGPEPGKGLSQVCDDMASVAASFVPFRL